MKVLKVIVDEMPESCAKCSYHSWQSFYAEYYCLMLEKRLGVELKPLMFSRPDWCPLITKVDYDNHNEARRWTSGLLEVEI